MSQDTLERMYGVAKACYQRVITNVSMLCWPRCVLTDEQLVWQFERLCTMHESLWATQLTYTHSKRQWTHTDVFVFCCLVSDDKYRNTPASPAAHTNRIFHLSAYNSKYTLSPRIPHSHQLEHHRLTPQNRNHLYLLYNAPKSNLPHRAVHTTSCTWLPKLESWRITAFFKLQVVREFDTLAGG